MTLLESSNKLCCFVLALEKIKRQNKTKPNSRTHEHNLDYENQVRKFQQASIFPLQNHKEEAFSYMGKSLPSSKLKDLVRILSSSSSERRVQRPKTRHLKPPPPAVKLGPETITTTRTGRQGGGGSSVELEPVTVKKLKMEGNLEGQERLPLALVVSDCVKRWFQDTLREAKNGDVSMQVLVGQMYFSGYGVARDPQKGRAWLGRASKSRSSVWKVSDKPPGYNASDSDSDELNDETK